MNLEWFTLFFSVITAGIGYYARHLIEKKKDLQDKATEERREVYQKFIDIVVDRLHFGDGDDIRNRMFEFYKKYLLYASPDVINALGNYQQYLFTHSIDERNKNIGAEYKKYAKIIYEMREDLGLSVKYLGDNGEIIFKTMLTNYSEIIKD